MSAQKKGENNERPAPVPPSALKTVVGVPDLPVHPARGGNIEELSGSLLIDEGTSNTEGMGARSQPCESGEPVAPAPQTAATPSQPAPERLVTIAFAGLATGVGLVFLAFTAFRYHGAASRASGSSATASRSAPLAAQSTTLAGPSKASTTIAACAVAGERRVVAPTATLTAGIEARSFGSDVALAFAPSEHDAMLVRLDPSSLATSESTVSHATYAIRHVTPIPGRGGRLGLAVDVDWPGDALQGRRTLPVDPPLQVGVAADGSLSWAPLEHGIQGKLWPMDGQGGAPVEALRGARSESNLADVAIVFRRRDSVWIGTAERADALTPKGGLSRIAGLGAMVGSPAVAIDEGVVVVAWADRATPDDGWQLRWTRFRVGDAPAPPVTFSPPAGGKGHEGMSPSLAVLPDQRFLLVWTEGLPNDHEVRALTLSADGKGVGAPLYISNKGVNAGQGQAAVTAGGRGVVAFLESFGGGFRVAVTPIACSH